MIHSSENLMMGSGGDDDELEEENMIYICGVSPNVKNNKNDERM